MGFPFSFCLLLEAVGKGTGCVMAEIIIISKLLWVSVQPTKLKIIFKAETEFDD